MMDRKKAVRDSDVSSVLRRYFGFDSLRPLQEKVISAFLQGRDCFVKASTGSGKSLCYQLPPLLLQRSAVVISPLISLMEDQCKSLRQADIKACALTSACVDKAVWEGARKGVYSLIYMSPERFERWQEGIQDLVSRRRICLFAIDEAHCISEWGHDFRSAYRGLHRIRQAFRGIPIMALTATATARVQADVMKSLRLLNPVVATTSLDRPNLHYAIRRKRSIPVDLTLDLLKPASDGSVIVYCLSRRQTEEVAQHLNSKGIMTRAYHGSLSSEERTKAHRDFVFDKVQVVAATVAFGMGIDKPDIRMVVHYGMPKTLEGYIQEAGRAGRDGQAARCVLFWSNSDHAMSNFYMKGISSSKGIREFREGSAAMEAFVKSASCRRAILLKHFGEVFLRSNCGRCDNCDDELRATRAGGEGGGEQGTHRRDFTLEARWFAKAMRDTRERFGLGVLVGVLKGSDAKVVRSRAAMFRSQPPSSLESYGALKSLDREYLKELVPVLVSAGVMQAHYVGVKQHRVFRLGPEGRSLLRDPNRSMPKVRVPSQLRQHLRIIDTLSSSTSVSTTSRSALRLPTSSSSFSPSSPSSSALGTDTERHLFAQLSMLRSRLACAAEIAPYMIFSKATLEEMARRRPITREAMLSTDGVGLQKLTTFGDEFMRLIETFARRNGMRTNVPCGDRAGGAGAGAAGGDAFGGDAGGHVPAPASPTKPSSGKSETQSSWQITRKRKPQQPQRSRALVSRARRTVSGELARDCVASGEGRGAEPQSRPRIRRRMSSGAMKVWRLFQERKQSPAEIASSELIRRSTVEESLAAAVELGLEVDWERLGVPETLFSQILSAYSAISGDPESLPEHGEESLLARIKRSVDEDVSFVQIRYALARIRRRRECGKDKVKDDDEQQGSSTDLAVEAVGAARDLPPLALHTWNMFQRDRCSTAEIANQNIVTPEQVEIWLAVCIEKGMVVDWERLGVEDSEIGIVERAVRDLAKGAEKQGHPSSPITPSLERVMAVTEGSGISPSRVRLIRARLLDRLNTHSCRRKSSSGSDYCPKERQDEEATADKDVSISKDDSKDPGGSPPRTELSQILSCSEPLDRKQEVSDDDLWSDDENTVPSSANAPLSEEQVLTVLRQTPGGLNFQNLCSRLPCTSSAQELELRKILLDLRNRFVLFVDGDHYRVL